MKRRKGKIMLEFVGLRSKMYAIRVKNKKDVKESKGTKLSAIRKLEFGDFKNALFNNEILTREQYLIKSTKHEVFTVKQKKIALSPYGDKRVINANLVNTKAWGFIDMVQIPDVTRVRF